MLRKIDGKFAAIFTTAKMWHIYVFAAALTTIGCTFAAFAAIFSILLGMSGMSALQAIAIASAICSGLSLAFGVCLKLCYDRQVKKAAQRVTPHHRSMSPNPLQQRLVVARR